VPHMLHGVVVALAVVAVAGIVPCVVSRVLSSGCMVLWSGSPCRVQCHCRSHCAVFGVTGAVVVPCLVLQLPSSCRASSHMCCRRAVFVLQFPSSHRTWCHGHCRCAAFGVAVAVIAPHVVLWSRWVSCSCVVSQSHSLRGGSGCCRTACCRATCCRATCCRAACCRAACCRAACCRAACCRTACCRAACYRAACCCSCSCCTAWCHSHGRCTMWCC
jgi:hypothetical protein